MYIWYQPIQIFETCYKGRVNLRDDCIMYNYPCNSILLMANNWDSEGMLIWKFPRSGYNDSGWQRKLGVKRIPLESLQILSIVLSVFTSVLREIYTCIYVDPVNKSCMDGDGHNRDFRLITMRFCVEHFLLSILQKVKIQYKKKAVPCFLVQERKVL